ncbi:hypothetical protein [Mycobacterium sherrisii]|uniref:Uncharacterized protein n=1 Tax=Mycobacterium sherrisii TaxID=243061 RepID=A0A1E3SU69_9MYCO|nr:hypothetical protein [Mycobacterium sherrisii]MCV7029197.1 hypothetical protein [Mycobacterium sherrisii]MEC4763309.1 hypothetical protein [Mycobacterium sherrisii]ODR05691.1 hypothetical protein BHQ21_13440 [Mycobacterium sherrisii]ORW76973.1 hypothetical protein AWC25_10620 [Mycobacterium sherrisii]
MDKQTRFPIGEAIWITVGIVLMFAFGDAFVLSALAMAAATMVAAWWAYRKVEHEPKPAGSSAAPATLRGPGAA